MNFRKWNVVKCSLYEWQVQRVLWKTLWHGFAFKLLKYVCKYPDVFCVEMMLGNLLWFPFVFLGNTVLYLAFWKWGDRCLVTYTQMYLYIIQQALLKRDFWHYDSVEKNIGNCMTVEVLKINVCHFFWSKLLLDITRWNVQRHSGARPCSVSQVLKREVQPQAGYSLKRCGLMMFETALRIWTLYSSLSLRLAGWCCSVESCWLCSADFFPLFFSGKFH